jgi:hypothetical protein
VCQVREYRVHEPGDVLPGNGVGPPLDPALPGCAALFRDEEREVMLGRPWDLRDWRPFDFSGTAG